MPLSDATLGAQFRIALRPDADRGHAVAAMLRLLAITNRPRTGLRSDNEATSMKTAFGVYVHCRSAVQVSLLRLQQPCAPCRHRRGASCAGLTAEIGPRLRAYPAARCRRSSLAAAAVADAARDRRRILDAIANNGPLRPMSSDARGQSDQRRRATRFRGYRAAASAACRWRAGAHDADSRRLGRLHTARGARCPLRSRARRSSAISFDLILRAARSDAQALDRAASSARSRRPAEHLSLYQSHRAGHAIRALHAAGKLITRRGSGAYALMTPTQEVCSAAGAAPYEISNHAGPAPVARMRHTSSTGRPRIAGIWSGRARAARTSQASAAATPPSAGPEAWLMRVEALVMGSSRMTSLMWRSPTSS